MRKITRIIVHCSDSDNPAHDNIEIINQWHKERGFTKVGYHFVILRDGTIEAGRRLDEVGAHCKGHNHDSIGVCLIGRSGFTPSQYISLGMLKQRLEYCLLNKIPFTKGYINNLQFFKHTQFDSGKTCPNFDSDLFTKL